MCLAHIVLDCTDLIFCRKSIPAQKRAPITFTMHTPFPNPCLYLGRTARPGDLSTPLCCIHNCPNRNPTSVDPSQRGNMSAMTTASSVSAASPVRVSGAARRSTVLSPLSAPRLQSSPALRKSQALGEHPRNGCDEAGRRFIAGRSNAYRCCGLDVKDACDCSMLMRMLPHVQHRSLPFLSSSCRITTCTDAIDKNAVCRRQQAGCPCRDQGCRLRWPFVQHR